jgi:hypothetical protein
MYVTAEAEKYADVALEVIPSSTAIDVSPL